MRAMLFVGFLLFAAALTPNRGACGGERQADATTSPAVGLRVFILDPGLLERTRQQVRAGDAAVAAAMKQLERKAKHALDDGPFTVVDEPTPPSGDKHDYMSLSIYWWPDPNAKDGLPYVHRDGQVNPEVNKYDMPKLSNMSGAVQTLALAYYLTGHEPYARHAARLLRAWFLDEASRMNPNMNFAQGVPGISSGARQGIIETAELATKVIDSVGLLAGSPSWSDADQRAMQAWFREYLKWLGTHPLALAESVRPNNHGIWYDLQVASFALFVGDQQRARSVLRYLTMRRICQQIQPDGRQPEELTRTKSWSYSLYNLDAMFGLASLGRRTDVDVWGFVGPEGQSIPQALDYLVAYLDDSQKWPHQQINSFSAPRELSPFVRRAVLEFGAARFEPMIEKVDPMPGSRFHLLYPK